MLASRNLRIGPTDAGSSLLVRPSGSGQFVVCQTNAEQGVENLDETLEANLSFGQHYHVQTRMGAAQAPKGVGQFVCFDCRRPVGIRQPDHSLRIDGQSQIVPQISISLYREGQRNAFLWKPIGPSVKQVHSKSDRYEHPQETEGLSEMMGKQFAGFALIQPMEEGVNSHRRGIRAEDAGP